MASAIRTIGHEDRLTLVEHLDELRTRLIVSALALAAAFGICMWQNGPLLKLVNRPLDRETQKAITKGHGPLGQTQLAQQATLNLAAVEKNLAATLAAPGNGLSPRLRAQLAPFQRQIDAAVAKVPRGGVGNKPVTLGIGEPFTTTVTVAFYFAVLLALPVILFEIYAFVLPAFSPYERRIALPLMLAIPALFIAGVVFGYLVVLPAAVRFLQNFNSDSFNVLVQASQYYRFAAILLLGMGLIFQVPVGILAATRAGVVTPRQLRKHRRYAIVLAAVVAALLPGDAITMLLEMAPLIVLYEASILLASVVARRDRKAAAAAAEGATTPTNDAV